MKVLHAAKHVLREGRGSAGRLVYVVGCLAIGVAAVVVVASVSRSLDQGIRAQAKELLGADLSIDSRRPLPPSVDAALAELPVIQRTNTREQPTMARAANGESLLVEIKSIDGPFPFYGSLELEPSGDLFDLVGDDSVVVAPDVVERLKVSVGDSLSVGGASFRIAAIARKEPDRITGLFYVGPRVFLSEAGFKRTALGDVGTRPRYKALVKLPETMDSETLTALTEKVTAALESETNVRVESYVQSRPQMRRGLGQMERYLGLVALLSLLMGGVGVAQAIRAWIGSRMDAIAVLKCIGFRPRELFALYAGQAALLGLAGSAVGVVLGVAVLYIVPPFFKEHLPVHLIQPLQITAVLRGFALGIGVTLVFSFPPLIAVLRVPPARVFRRDAEPLPEARWVPWATAIAVMLGVALLALLQAGTPRLAAMFTGGVFAAGAVLTLAGWGVAHGVSRLPRESGRVWLRHGLASLGRPGASTLASITALGFGILVIFCVNQVQGRLNDELDGQIPKNAPSAILLDIKPGQATELGALLAKEGAGEINVLPIVITRIAAIDGADTAEAERRDRDKEDDGGHRRHLRREQSMTYLSKLSDDNTIVEGALWSDPTKLELSIEEHFAEETGIKLGSILTIIVNAVPTDFTVTSIRHVDWRGMDLNFEIVAEPGPLDNAPQMRVATVRFPKGDEHRIQNAILGQFPNVTVVGISEMLERIGLQLTRMGYAVRFLGLFITAAGIAVLAGAIGIDSQRRGREVALLKTLGMTRREVVALFAVEYALIGLVAGIVGVAGGGAMSWWTIVHSLELDWTFKPLAFLGALAAGVALAVIAGAGSSIGALRKRPIEVLRGE